jgi:5,10-methylenetetrahydromethanopterin reductase
MKFRTQDLSAYILPGRAVDPRDAFVQARAAEQLRLGGIWASERWETKETGALCGALSQITSTIKIAAGVTHFGTRHPMVLAGLASTMQYLSNGRFILGFGRSVVSLWPNMGLAPVTLASMGDSANILRRLWKGEEVSYDGPAGRYPKLRMAQLPETPPPIMLAAIGPKTLELGGSHFDAVALHPFLTTEAVRKSCDVIRRGAEAAGRDPRSVKIYAAVVVAPDLSPEERASSVDARAVSYFVFPDLGGAIVKMNGWDPAPLQKVLAEKLDMIEREQRSNTEIRARLAAASSLLPPEWITQGAAVGSAIECAARLREYRSAGADGLTLHGTTTDRLGPLVAAYAGHDP